MSDVIDFDELRKVLEPVFQDMENDIKENEVRKKWQNYQELSGKQFRERAEYTK